MADADQTSVSEKTVYEWQSPESGTVIEFRTPAPVSPTAVTIAPTLRRHSVPSLSLLDQTISLTPYLPQLIPIDYSPSPVILPYRCQLDRSPSPTSDIEEERAHVRSSSTPPSTSRSRTHVYVPSSTSYTSKPPTSFFVAITPATSKPIMATGFTAPSTFTSSQVTRNLIRASSPEETSHKEIGSGSDEQCDLPSAGQNRARRTEIKPSSIYPTRELDHMEHFVRDRIIPSTSFLPPPFSCGIGRGHRFPNPASSGLSQSQVDSSSLQVTTASTMGPLTTTLTTSQSFPLPSGGHGSRQQGAASTLTT